MLVHNPLNELPQNLSRGNPERLYGLPAFERRASNGNREHVVTPQEERDFLIHERYTLPLAALDFPQPEVNSSTYANEIRTRLEAPIWERFYSLEGDISVSGRRGFAHIGGKLFKPSTQGLTPPFHSTFRRFRELARKRRSSTLDLDTVLLLRHPLENIYFHSVHDLLCKLAWAKEIGISQKTTIVVSASWAESRFGKHFLKSKLFDNWKVIIQGKNESVVCRRLYWLQPPQFNRMLLDRIAKSFNLEKPSQKIGTRIVLIRNKATINNRTCLGFEILVDRLKERGYQAIDPAEYSIAEQKYIFSKARHIVTENGSSLTNTIFRADGALDLDVVVASHKPTATFQALSAAYGFKHRAHLIASVRNASGIISELDDQTIKKILANSYNIKD